MDYGNEKQVLRQDRQEDGLQQSGDKQDRKGLQDRMQDRKSRKVRENRQNYQQFNYS